MLLGEDASSHLPVEWDPSPTSGTANPHLLIVGESGYGKTYAIQCLVAELVSSGRSAVVVDYAQGFATSSVHTMFTRVARPVEILASTRGISINPLTISTHDTNGPVNVAVRVSDTFARIYNIGVQQHSLLRDVIIETFEAAGIRRDRARTWQLPAPTLSDVFRSVALAATDRDRTDYRIALSLKSHISSFFIFDTFRRTGDHLSWSSMMTGSSRCYIVQLHGLEGKTEKAVTEFLLWDLYNFLRSQGPRDLRLVCVLDEAHKLSFAESAPVEKLLRESRKFGVGLILSSQQPEDFSNVAHSNTATKIVFHTTDRKRTLTKALAVTSPQLGHVDDIALVLSRLRRGEALYVHGDRTQIVAITKFEARAPVRHRLMQIKHP